MAILAECPICHKKQTMKNKRCKCGEDLDKAKRSKRVRYWISYRIGNKQRRESVGQMQDLNGFSIEDARAAEAKRKVQKREKRVLDILPGTEMTFNELAAWYLNTESVKKKKTYDRIQGCLANFNEVFGHQLVCGIKPLALEEYQGKREAEGRASATIDMEIMYAQAMVTKAFDNDKVDGRALKAFRNVERRLRKGTSARERVLTLEEYLKLIKGTYIREWKIRGRFKKEEKSVSSPHLKAILEVAMHTGMRKAEILRLEWAYIDRDNKMIRFPMGPTKEGRKKGIPENSPDTKNIPINHYVQNVLDSLPRALHHRYLFAYKGKPILKLRRSFESACRNAGIPYGRKVESGLTFHDIRATFKTNLLRAGVDKVYRDTIVGHSLKGMDAHYMRPKDSELRLAMKKYTSWFDDEFQNVDHTVDQGGSEG